MKQWNWVCVTPAARLAGVVYGVDLRDALSRMLTSTTANGKLFGEEQNVPPSVLQDAPGNNDESLTITFSDTTIELNVVPNSTDMLTGEVRRAWVDSLRTGDEVEVPYSPDRSDIYRMTVIKKDGGWLTLLTVGARNRPKNWVKACAVLGLTVPFNIRLVPIGTTQATDWPEGPDSGHLAALQRYANSRGRCWKHDLSLAWESGQDERETDGGFLRGVRNEFGPHWLFSKLNRIRPQTVR